MSRGADGRRRARVAAWRAAAEATIGEPVQAIDVFTRPGALERFSIRKFRQGARLAPGFPVNVMAVVTVDRLVFLECAKGPARPGRVVWSGPLATTVVTSPPDRSCIVVRDPTGVVATLEPTFGTRSELARLLRVEFEASARVVA